MPLTGDFGKLDRWAKKFGDLGSNTTRFEIADEMSDVALGLVAHGFARESDPFGRRWKPKKKSNGRPVLRGKHNLLVRWRKEFVNQHGYRIGSAAPYAGYHQSGTRHMVARKMVPGARLPPRWSSELRGVYVDRMRKLLR